MSIESKDDSLVDILEAVGKIKKFIAVRDGRKQVVAKKQYTTECRPGYKRDRLTGACVRMSAEERQNRSKAAKKVQNKSATKRKRSISIKRRNGA